MTNSMPKPPLLFDHDRLAVYRVAIEFVAWVGSLLDGPLSSCRHSVVGQLDRASTSIPLNIAEGNGKRSLVDRCRYLDTSRGSAFESAACLDVLVARRVLEESMVDEGKALLVRIVSMLSKMILRFDVEATEGTRSTSTSTSTK
jgi:four helix bundle protein